MSAVAASRREVMTSLALGAGALTAVVAPTTAAAQERESPIADAETLRQVHGRFRARRMAQLGDTDPESPVGLRKVIDDLENSDVIQSDEGKLLREGVDEVEKADSEDGIAGWFDSIYGYVTSGVSNLAKRTFEYAKETFDSVRCSIGNLSRIKFRIYRAFGRMLRAATTALVYRYPVVALPAAALSAAVTVGVLSLPDDLDDQINC